MITFFTAQSRSQLIRNWRGLAHYLWTFEDMGTQ